MSRNTIIVLIWILLACVLIVENMIMNMPAYVFIWNSHSWKLWLICLAVGFMIWFWARGWLEKKNFDEDEDNFDF